MVRALRLLVAIGVLAVLIASSEHQAVFARFARIEPSLAAMVVVTIIVDGLLRAFNWLQLIRRMQLAPAPTYGRVLSCYWAGCFIGQVVPSSAATDGLRAMFAVRSVGGGLAAHLVGLMALNVVSLLAGSIVGLICGAWLGVAAEGHPGVRGITLLLFAGLILGAACGFFVISRQRGLLLWFMRRMRKGILRKVRKALRGVLRKLRTLRSHPFNPLPVLGISLLTLCTRTAAFALAGAAVGVYLPVAAWLSLTPAVMLSGLIPYSIAGFGGDQAAVVFLVTGFGVAADAALAFALLLPLVPMSFNLLGGLVLAFGGPRSAPPQQTVKAPTEAL